MRVLLREDENTLAETLAAGLRADGFAVVGLRRCDASPDRNGGGPTAVAIPIFVKFYGRQAAP